MVIGFEYVIDIWVSLLSNGPLWFVYVLLPHQPEYAKQNIHSVNNPKLTALQKVYGFHFGFFFSFLSILKDIKFDHLMNVCNAFVCLCVRSYATCQKHTNETVGCSGLSRTVNKCVSIQLLNRSHHIHVHFTWWIIL